MRKCLKTSVAKTEQDALTTTGGSHCLIVCGSHKKAYSRRVGRQTERYSPGGWRSQRVLFARSCCDAPVRRPGVSADPPGRLRSRAGGQKENPLGLSKTDHVMDHNWASSGGNKWIQTVSMKWWTDRCLKQLLPRFYPRIHLCYQPKTQSGAAAKESVASLTSWDTNDFSYLPKLNVGVGYVHFSTTRKWLNKLLKSVLSKESWMFGFLSCIADRLRWQTQACFLPCTDVTVHDFLGLKSLSFK